MNGAHATDGAVGERRGRQRAPGLLFLSFLGGLAAYELFVLRARRFGSPDDVGNSTAWAMVLLALALSIVWVALAVRAMATPTGRRSFVDPPGRWGWLLSFAVGSLLIAAWFITPTGAESAVAAHGPVMLAVAESVSEAATNNPEACATPLELDHLAARGLRVRSVCANDVARPSSSPDTRRIADVGCTDETPMVWFSLLPDGLGDAQAIVYKPGCPPADWYDGDSTASASYTWIEGPWYAESDLSDFRILCCW